MRFPSFRKASTLLYSSKAIANTHHRTNIMTISPHMTALEQARQLDMPSREAMLRRDSEVASFWSDNDQLLEQAWREWAAEPDVAASLPDLDDSLFDPKLREAVTAAWKDPENFEAQVKDLWKEVAPGVYMCQFLDPCKLEKLRVYLEMAAEANIPTRPP